jgi:hypothetical protein
MRGSHGNQSPNDRRSRKRVQAAMGALKIGEFFHAMRDPHVVRPIIWQQTPRCPGL